MNSRSQALRIVLAAVLVLLMAGCATTDGPFGAIGEQNPPSDEARMAALQGDYERAARLYVEAAGQARQPEAQRGYRLEAGLAAAQAGDAQTARQMLASIDPSSLGAIDQARYNLAQREIAIADLPPAEALSHLPRPAENTAPAVAERVWEKRAQLQLAAGNTVAGIAALVQREAWLNNAQALQANDERIYEQASNAIGLGIGPDSPDAASADETTRGWLALADIGQSQFGSDQSRNQALAQWQQDYPGHPANRSILPERFNYQATASVTPVERGMNTGQPTAGATRTPNNRVALALPMDGPFQNAAQAIRDGFNFAYQNNSAGLPNPVFFNTAGMSMSALANEIDRDRIGLLVGPLSKDNVSAMLNQSISIPEIALNTVDQTIGRAGFYQFGLDPADEAASAARHALDQGYDNALALVPQGEWGDRVLDGFRQALSAGDGRLIDYRTYNADSHDHSQAIQQVLGSGNQANADFIFVAAQPTQARLIRSQLKYYDAASLPMVTTSHAYTGQADADSDIDLNGVYFVDMPWLLGGGGTISRLRREAEARYGSSATAYGRLFAMGMDAWVLARRLVQDQLQTEEPLEGMSGVLSIRPSGHVTRYLGWAVFRNGVPQTLSMPQLSTARQATGTTAAGGRSGERRTSSMRSRTDSQGEPWSSVGGQN